MNKVSNVTKAVIVRNWHECLCQITLRGLVSEAMNEHTVKVVQTTPISPR